MNAAVGEVERWKHLVVAAESLHSQGDPQRVLAELARLLVPSVADWCAIDVRDPAGRPRRSAVAHRLPERERSLAEAPLDGAWAEAACAGLDGQLVSLAAEGAAGTIAGAPRCRALVCAPLRGRELVHAVVTLAVEDDVRTLGPQEAQRAAAVAVIAGHAFEAAQRHQVVQRRLRRASFLAEAGAQIGAGFEPHATAERVARLTVPFLADWCALDLVEDEGPVRVAAFHADPRRRELLLEIARLRGRRPRSEPDLVPEVSEARLEALAPEPEERRLLREVGCASLLSAPLPVRGQTVGTLLLGIAHSGRRFDQEDLSLAEDLARRTALAVDNARLFRKAQDAGRRAAFLADVGAQLAATLDLSQILDRLALATVPFLGDYCAIDLREADGRLRRAAVAHVDPTKVELVRQMGEQMTFGANSSHLQETITTGRSTLIPDLRRDALEAAAAAVGALDLVRAVGPRSYLVAALQVGGRILGALTICTAESQRRFGPADLALAEDLARRAALAVDHARLFREAQDAVTLREEFLSVASHELRTPLNALLLSVEALGREMGRNRGSCPRAAPLLEKLGRQARRIAQLVDNLLDATRCTHGQLSLRREPVALGGLVRDVVARFDDEAEHVGSTITVVTRSEGTGQWDRMRIEQVVTNLVSNALKYGRGGPIEVEVEFDEERARITVRDHGAGIAARDLDRIFGRFERADREGHKGLGLGLYIVDQIVRALGGRATVQSVEGEGSCFTVELPR